MTSRKRHAQILALRVAFEGRGFPAQGVSLRWGSRERGVPEEGAPPEDFHGGSTGKFQRRRLKGWMGFQGKRLLRRRFQRGGSRKTWFQGFQREGDNEGNGSCQGPRRTRMRGFKGEGLQDRDVPGTVFQVKGASGE